MSRVKIESRNNVSGNALVSENPWVEILPDAKKLVQGAESG
jgi:hypothetical protein